jgi:hypothetical protein
MVIDAVPVEVAPRLSATKYCTTPVPLETAPVNVMVVELKLSTLPLVDETMPAT